MKTDKNFIVIVAIFIVVLAVSLPMYFMVPAAGNGTVSISKFPMQVNEWSAKDLEVDERAYEILETRNLILREYTKGSSKVYLYAIYSEDNRKVSHPPEVCFEGSGITIVKKSKFPLELASGKKISANLLEVEKEGTINLVVYFYKAGPYYVDNYLKQQMKIALAALQFKRTSGAMIRFSAEVNPKMPEQAAADIREFANQASEHFDEVMP